MTARLSLIAALLVIGAGWGMSVPLIKIAVSEGYQPLGLVFWQFVIVSAFLGAIGLLRGRRVCMARAHLGLYVMIAVLGALLPDGLSYMVAVHLPAGVLAIIMSAAPMFAFPIALALGNDVFRPGRLAGLMIGLVGIVLLMGPKASLPDPAVALFVPIALLAPVCYATEGNLVARWGTGELDPIQVLTGASLVGAIMSLPLALASGQWINPLPPYGLPDLAFIASSVIHALVYAAYVWLIGRAGSVFAAQVAYLVTGFGVLWSMLLLSENYSGHIWSALALMLTGVFLVQPRPRMRLAPGLGIGDTDAEHRRDGKT